MMKDISIGTLLLRLCLASGASVSRFFGCIFNPTLKSHLLFETWPPRLCIACAVGQFIYLAVSTTPAISTDTDQVPIHQRQISQALINAKIDFGEQSKDAPAAKSQLIPGVTVCADYFGADEANRLARAGVIIGSRSDKSYVDLENGNILLNPERDITVGTPEGEVHIKSGATVFVMRSDDGIVVYNLQQTKPKQVFVALNKQSLTVDPGKMFVLSRENIADFEKLKTNCHSVDYYNVKPLSLHNSELKAFIADFSITSAFVTIEPVKRLIASDNKQDRLALERLMKGAIVLQGAAAKVQGTK